MEKNQPIKLIALDMDGTLLTSEEKISEKTRETIAKALEKGVHVILSTGRSIRTCYSHAESLKLTSYLITVNGGEIWTVEKELLEQHLLDTAMIEKLWKFGEIHAMHTWMMATDNVWHDARPEKFTDHKWLKFGFSSQNTDRLADLVTKLSQYDELELTNSFPTNIEINPIGVSKASALEKVCAKIGITMDNVMAVGDSLNDYKMIQQAGIGVAMGNAQEKIKETADHITDSNDQDGVAKAIERFVL